MEEDGLIRRREAEMKIPKVAFEGRPIRGL